jgi:ATP-dependent helicase HrpB
MQPINDAVAQADLEPGTCYRLWTTAEQQGLLPRRPPEILEADLAPLALDLAEWGVIETGELSWLDPPPAGALAQARELLRQLGALDAQGALTAHGRRLAHVTVHPRLAHMMVTAVPIGLGTHACDLAALLSERDILQGGPGWRNADLRIRVEALRTATRDHLAGATINRAGCERVRRASEQWRRQLQLTPSSVDGTDHTGTLLASPTPTALRNGSQAARVGIVWPTDEARHFTPSQGLSQEEYLVVAQLDGTGDWARILLAAPVTSSRSQHHCAGADLFGRRAGMG